jgi:hypothetical protein
MVVTNLLLLCLLLFGPIALGFQLTKYWESGSSTIAFSVMLNAIDLLAGSAALILGLALLVHRLLWPIFEKPLYALQRYEVIRNKRLLWGVGLALAFLPTHLTLDVVKTLMGRLP